jgi:hypothetical protein
LEGGAVSGKKESQLDIIAWRKSASKIGINRLISFLAHWIQSLERQKIKSLQPVDRHAFSDLRI